MQAADASLFLNLVVFQGVRFLGTGLDCQMHESHAHVLGGARRR